MAFSEQARLVPVTSFGRLWLALSIAWPYAVPVLSIYLFWLYSNKFLGMSISYLSTMARDITIAGTQMNTSYYPMEGLALIVGGIILICFLLVQNEIPALLRGLLTRNPKALSECSSSIFAILDRKSVV